LIFQELAEHLPRQAENYLTQTLLVVFNTCPSFRREFLEVFPNEVDPSLHLKARMSAQVAFRDRDGRGRLDAKIAVRGQDILAIEIKLTASIGDGQLVRYKRHLARLRCPLVVIDAHGSFDELPPVQRRYANEVISWSRVAQVARAAHRVSRTAEERFVLEDWMRFLEENGFVAARPLEARDWRILERLALLVSGRGADERRLDNLPDSLSSATAAALRLERHRDDLMSHFSAEWRPFSGMFRYPAVERLKNDFSVQFEAGLWRHASTRRLKFLYDGSFLLALEFVPKPRLSVVLYRGLKAVHPEYGLEHDETLFAWTSQQTRRLFEMEFEDAHLEMKPVLLRCVRRAMASRHWRDLTGRNETLRTA
jgi:hypothetical protein